MGDYGRIFRLLLLTGCRRREIGELRWDELRDEPLRIELPPARVKNNRMHTVPLTQLAFAQLRYPRPGHDWVFGDENARVFNGWHWGEGLLAARVVLEPRFTLHDCRRTMATNMQRLGVKQEVVEKMLNHGMFAGVAGIYQRYEFADEKRAAAELWSAEVARIVGTSANPPPPQPPPEPDPIDPLILDAFAQIGPGIARHMRSQNPEA
jgi:integrase